MGDNKQVSQLCFRRSRWPCGVGVHQLDCWDRGFESCWGHGLRLLFLGKWPTWRTIFFYVFISILYMFRATSCSSSGESGKFLSDLHTKRSSTQSDIYQMLYWYNLFSWLWARGCSKHVENWNKYIEKNCASSRSFTKNHNKMHGKQNIKFCTSLVLWR